jgi:membrane protein YqaA with SNARE-associated domain
LRPGSKSLAALWGLAEATLFFIVPDVLLSCLALGSVKKALWACLTASLGAVCGGLLVFWCAAHHPETTRTILLSVPGISTDSFSKVDALIRQGLYPAMLKGAFSGIPYKLFAAEAAASDQSAVWFALFTPAARLPRFILISLITAGLSRYARNRLSPPAKLALCLTLWAVFYAFYFSWTGW